MASAAPMRRMSAALRREQLLDVTAELAAELGFHAVSVEAVSRRSGITRAVVYQHFADLQALLETVVEREASRALTQVAGTELTDLTEGDPAALMLESLGAYLRAVAEHPATWRLVLMPPEGAPATLRQSIEDGRRGVLARLTQTVRTAQRHADAADAELTARLFSAVADEYARLVLTDPQRNSPERLLRHARAWLEQSTFGL